MKFLFLLFLKACKLFKVQCFDQKMFAGYSTYQRVDIACKSTVRMCLESSDTHNSMYYAFCTGPFLCGVYRLVIMHAPKCLLTGTRRHQVIARRMRPTYCCSKASRETEEDFVVCFIDEQYDSAKVSLSLFVPSAMLKQESQVNCG